MGKKNLFLRAWIGANNGETQTLGYQTELAVPGQTSTYRVIGSASQNGGTPNHATRVTADDGVSPTTNLQPSLVLNYIIKT